MRVLAVGCTVLGLIGPLALAPARSETTTAAVVAPDYLKALAWRSIGPSRGGRVLAVAGDPANPLVFYFGATGGGVWKTEDGGQNWRNISDGTFKTGAVGAIAVAPSNPNVIYVGMGEAAFRGNASYGDGVYKSTDGGKTWQNVGLAPTRHISRIRVHPKDPNLVYVAALGDGFGPSPDRGLYRSKDGGKSWEKILFRNDDTGAADLVFDPNDPKVMYASLLELRRFPWAIRSAGPGTGLFKSTDGGDTWKEITSNPGLPDGLKGRIGLALSPVKPERVWAIIDAATGKKGVFRSDDGGATWARVSDDANLTQRPWYYHQIFADPKDADTLYVLNIDMWKSTDGGKTYEEINTPHGDNHDLWIDPNNPLRMIEGNDGGATVSFNGGKSWSTILNQPTAQMYHVTTDNRFPYRVYGAQQDNTTIALPSRSDTGAIGPDEWYTVGGGEAGYIAVNPANPDVTYAGDHHWLHRYDHRTRQVRDISPWPETHYGWGPADINYRFQWTYPVMLSPHDPKVLYATAQVVFRTTNEGQNWEKISPDLTRHEPSRLEKTPAYGNEKIGEYWGPITRDNTGAEWYSTIFAFAESPKQKGVLWAGSDDGYVHVSRDNGKTWVNVTPKDLPEFALVSIIDPSPHDPAVAYLAATRYKLQDRTPYLYKTSDYGKTWTRITGGIGKEDFTRVIRVDPGKPGLLYVGTETGVYVSFDDGSHWQSLQLNLPVVPIHDLVVKNGDLVAATHGRSFWILDNVALLHQFDREALAQPVKLFAPPTTVRFRAGASTALREATDENAGKNPPSGVVVSYFLKEKPQGEVSLAFLDAQGRAIRTFTSSESTPARFRVSAKPGANRFVWDMRYPGANVIPGTTLHRRPDGPVAPPGTYKVALTVDGKTYTENFAIVRDPRIPYTDADLKEQFDFLISVRDRLTETHDAVRQIRAMRKQAEAAVVAVRGKSGADAVERSFTTLNTRLYLIEERLSQYRARATQDLTNYPSGIDNKLVVLMGHASMADAPPTRQSYELFADLSKRAAERTTALKEVMRSDWPAFQKIVAQVQSGSAVGEGGGS
jgi:photosystem II stability/assembly factor-like uncharacterized protein